MEGKINQVLVDKVNPILAEHYGSATISKFDNGIVWVKLNGACSSCPSAQMTIEEVVKDIILQECDFVKDVRLDTSVSEDLIEMAKKLLKKPN